jgi:hypothetical protein
MRGLSFAAFVLLGVTLACSLPGGDATPTVEFALPSGETTEPGAEETEESSAPSETAPPTGAPASPTTSGPAPGSLLYTTEFDNFSGWTVFPWWRSDVQDFAGANFTPQIANYVAEIRNGRYHVEIPKRYTHIAAVYNPNLLSPDVTIVADTELTLARPWTFISVLCRYSQSGWYELYIQADGHWGIDKLSYVDGTLYQVQTLASGPTGAINNQNHGDLNKLTATCKGDTLLLTVNGSVLGSAQDSSFPSGLIGVGAAAGEQGNSLDDFNRLAVEVPN